MPTNISAIAQQTGKTPSAIRKMVRRGSIPRPVDRSGWSDEYAPQLVQYIFENTRRDRERRTAQLLQAVARRKGAE